MFQIRREQMKALAAYQDRQLEDRLVAHLERTVPERLVRLTEEKLRQLIRLGIHKAGSYGLVSAGPLATFLQVQFQEGTDFDADPERPWVREILGDPARDEDAKIGDLLDRLDDGSPADDEDQDLADTEDDTEDREDEPPETVGDTTDEQLAEDDEGVDEATS